MIQYDTHVWCELESTRVDVHILQLQGGFDDIDHEMVIASLSSQPLKAQHEWNAH